MPTINYQIRSKNNSANIYMRYCNTSKIQILTKLDIHVNPIHWDSKKQRIKNVTIIKNRDQINQILSKLEIHVLNETNTASINGTIIDSTWLKNVIHLFFNRPKSNYSKYEPEKVYYVDFAKWWIDIKSNTWLSASDKYMSDTVKNQYLSFIDLVNEYQKKSKLKIIDITSDVISSFAKWLSEKGYSANTIKRHINRFKFFCHRAEGEGLKVNKKFEQRVFTPKSEDVIDPILTPDEIDTIYKLKLDNSLNDIRDSLIIGCWTGLRISDFNNNLDISNFIDDYIEITTQKTKTKVLIPIHPMVKEILIKRNGKLPKKVPDQIFNKKIKVVCEKAGLLELMTGKLFKKETKRKEIGIYPKHLLISSHVARRSFATNHFGHIPNDVIMSICGWSKEEMMLKYIKKTKKDKAIALKKYWENNYQIQ